MVVTVGSAVRSSARCAGCLIEDLPYGHNLALHRTRSPSRPCGSVQKGDHC